MKCAEVRMYVTGSCIHKLANKQIGPVWQNFADTNISQLTVVEAIHTGFSTAGDVFSVSCVATVTPEVYHYQTRISRVLERFCTYTVNGKSARGLTEYHYR